jgi:cytosine/uracil/thiamine/allantoin permease
MTSALAGVGACYVLTGLGIRSARGMGRVVLVGGGVATVLVAAFPQPERGNSVAHTVAATIAFTALAAWPVLAARMGSQAPLLRPRISIAATFAMFGLLIWFVLEAHGSHRGLAERAAAFTEALWPFLVVATALGSAASSGSVALEDGGRTRPTKRSTCAT